MKQSNDISNLIDKVASGQASSEEVMSLQQMSTENDEIRQELQEAELTIALAEEALLRESINTEAAWKLQAQAIKSVDASATQRMRWFVAASLALLVAAGWAISNYLTPAQQHMVTNSFEELFREFPDGTEITLNENSSLTYSEDMSSERIVKLQGEAFFDVTSNPEIPFVIEMSQGTITVLGTRFNVKTTEEELGIYLDEGSIAFQSTANHEVILTPNDLLILNKTVTVIENTNPNVIAWYTNDTFFADEPLDKVFETLSIVHKRRIHFEPTQLSGCQLTANYRGLSFEEVMENVCSVFDLTYRHEENYTSISGSGCSN